MIRSDQLCGARSQTTVLCVTHRNISFLEEIVYTKTVVAASVSAQKYNPELTWSQRTQDIRIAQLSDKLRHIRQVIYNCGSTRNKHTC
uniref:Uncharacterized protein n=1 Tax=Timema douglasi TaxID=61478 RepID=A0A7R8VZ44_TIMDO|nr:unnamed protein product [Timema douglasi]